MKKFNIKDDEWCLTAQDRRVWRTECKEGLKECTQEQLENDRRRRATAVASLRQPEHDVVSNRLECGTCHRSFRRKQDIGRHKCQRSRDVHQDQREVEQQAQTQPTTAQPTTQLTCYTGARSFRQRQDLSRHKCSQQSTTAQPTTQLTCSSCGRSFRRTQDISRHKCRLTRDRKNVT